MWQIHWVISLIPDTALFKIYNLILIVGIILYLGSKLFRRFPFKYIPFFGQYPFIAEIVGIVCICSSIYLLCGWSTEMQWRKQVEEVQAKVSVAEQASADANAKLEIEHNKKVALLTERKILYKERIKKEIVRIDKECKLDPVVPKIHNDAAQNPYRKGDGR